MMINLGSIVGFLNLSGIMLSASDIKAAFSLFFSASKFSTTFAYEAEASAIIKLRKMIHRMTTTRNQMMKKVTFSS